MCEIPLSGLDLKRGDADENGLDDGRVLVEVVVQHDDVQPVAPHHVVGRNDLTPGKAVER